MELMALSGPDRIPVEKDRTIRITQTIVRISSKYLVGNGFRSLFLLTNGLI